MKPKKQLMFKRYFVGLCNTHSDISLALIKEGKPYPRLNWKTVRLYHKIHGTGK